MKLPEFPDYDFFIINEDVVVVNKKGLTLKGTMRPGSRTTVYMLRYHTGKNDYVYVSNGRLAVMMQFNVTYRHLKENRVKYNFTAMEQPARKWKSIDVCDGYQNHERFLAETRKVLDIIERLHNGSTREYYAAVESVRPLVIGYGQSRASIGVVLRELDPAVEDLREALTNLRIKGVKPLYLMMANALTTRIKKRPRIFMAEDYSNRVLEEQFK